ncbi:hypothetical protein [Kordiimonas sp.]|uniref:hypothetical protein n=1 Tax=Kordiimonas sp. TaxID=1970157 RepID=UPI003A8DBEBE
MLTTTHLRRYAAFCVIALGLYCPASYAGAEFDKAQAELFALHVAEGRKAMVALVGNERAPMQDRARAALFLSDMSARMDKDMAAAMNWIAMAERYGAPTEGIAAATARAMIEGGEPRKAITHALKASELAANGEKAEERTLLYAESLMAAYDSPTASLARRALAINAQTLRQALQDNPSSQAAAKMLFDFSVRLGDGDTMLMALTALIPAKERGSGGQFAGSFNTLKKELAGWLGSTLVPERRRKIVLALAELRLAKAAALIADKHPSRGKKDFLAEDGIREVMAYAAFLDTLNASLEDIYRARARGEGVDGRAFAAFDAAAKAFAVRVPAALSGKTYDRDAFTDYIRQRFGALLNWDEKGTELKLGHQLASETTTISQHGVQADITALSVGFMAARGFEVFVLGSHAPGRGWNSDEGLVQLAGSEAAEAGGVQTGAALWQRCGTGVDGAKRAYEIRDISRGDEALLGDKKVAYLPGLKTRLEWQACRALLHMLKRSGLEKERIEGAFTAEADFAITEGQVNGYQARFAIERAKAGEGAEAPSDATLEYRARLAMIIKSPRPRFALSGTILLPGIGGDTAEGQANAEVLEGLIAWMEKHASEVVAYDKNRPALLQLDHLSDEQIIKAARGLDPLE